MKEQHYPLWLTSKGEKVSCTEKIKVMQQNLDELKQIAADAFEDGILMGIDPNQLKAFLVNLIQNLNNPYKTGFKSV